MFENDRNDLDSQLTEADLLQWIEVETHKQYNVARMLVDGKRSAKAALTGPYF